MFDKLERLEAAAKSKGRSMLGHTLQESLDTVGITSLILGASRLEQLEQAVLALNAAGSAMPAKM